MRCLVMFIAAVCLIFLLKLKWTKTKSVYDKVWLIEQLIDSLSDWLIDWLIDWYYNFSPKKKIGASTGFEPMEPLQCSANWAMKIHIFGADQFIDFIFYPWHECEIKLIWTARIRMKLRCDHGKCNLHSSFGRARQP